MATAAQIEGWIHAVALGDRAAFDRLYAATSAKLFGVCLHLLKDRGDAEEVLQEAYVRVWQKADRYASNGLSPMTWLITLTRNLAIDKLRARKAPAEDLGSIPEIPDTGPSPEGAAVAASEAQRIGICLDELVADRAEAVRGAYLLGQSYAELAEKFAVPINTMRSWLRRSLIQLKDCLSR